MATVDAPRMTVEEFLALPDDGVRRMLIDGEVREIGMTMRPWRHGALQATIGSLLQIWLRDRPRPRGLVVGGEAGFRLAPRTLVGLDIAYVSPELVASTPESQDFFHGSPTLAVEIATLFDKPEHIDDRVGAFLEAGVPLVWVIRSDISTVTAYRPDAEPRLYTIRDEIDAEPHLPGFRAAVATIFED